jgi:hypothetical protein
MASNLLRKTDCPLSGLGSWLSWGAILAALFDMVENIALIILVWGTLSNPWPEIARFCAIVKFTLVFIGIVYVIYGGVVALVERISLDE